jgi:poly(A) polymerase
VTQRLEGIEVPRFPLGGNDLIQRGIQPGPALGAELERLEKEWIASDFRLGRMDLLAMVRPG